MMGSQPSEAGPSKTRIQLPPLTELVRPPNLRGSKTLDKDALRVEYPILSVKVKSADVGKYLNDQRLRACTMDLPRLRHVVQPPDDISHKIIRLRVQSADELPDDVRDMVEKETEGFVEDKLVLDYNYWTSSDILNAILPKTGDGDFAPSSFTQTGHIGHVNLREEWLPYKSLIGQVILEKNQKLRTIVNKLDSIHAEYRYFDMEVLAGEEDFITTVSESDCTFKFDFSRVYWNSRLQGEHDRLIQRLKPGTVVADVMAGVGPFAVPAAKKGCHVLGNDLNPESVKWMRENRIANKVEKTLRVYEIDGRDFIKQSPKMVWTEPFAPYVKAVSNRKQEKEARKLRQQQAASGSTSQSSTPSAAPQAELSGLSITTNTTGPALTAEPSKPQAALPLKPQLVQHYIMNLPDTALLFLDAFRGLYSDLISEPGFKEKLADIGMPLIHVYCFTRETEPEGAESDICKRASEAIGREVTPEIGDYELYLVRRVAPNKDMYCLTFRLPESVAFEKP